MARKVHETALMTVSSNCQGERWIQVSRHHVMNELNSKSKEGKAIPLDLSDKHVIPQK